ncbi:hypothetical protein ABZ897_04415 [Nonomuraea sp. NPDC046802]|uniref:hypothetical protein n=1 Tax=Nonomuraea sp. NPDC046802 TaxID=3154919 RepID=UPI0033EBCCAF
MEEFAWDWADLAAAARFYDAGSLPAAVGVADFPGDPVARWREAHVDHHPAADMLAAIKDRFEWRNYGENRTCRDISQES